MKLFNHEGQNYQLSYDDEGTYGRKSIRIKSSEDEQPSGESAVERTLFLYWFSVQQFKLH